MQSVEYPDKTNIFFLCKKFTWEKSAVQKRGYLFLGFDEDDKLGVFFTKGKHNQAESNGSSPSVTHLEEADNFPFPISIPSVCRSGQVLRDFQTGPALSQQSVSSLHLGWPQKPCPSHHDLVLGKPQSFSIQTHAPRNTGPKIPTISATKYFCFVHVMASYL